MRKVVFVPILLILLLAFMGCKPSKLEPAIEMIAFSSLTSEEQDLIQVSPKDSVVVKISVSDEIKSYFDRAYDEDEVYSVTFNRTETDSTSNLTVYVSLDKKTVVGKGSVSR